MEILPAGSAAPPPFERSLAQLQHIMGAWGVAASPPDPTQRQAAYDAALLGAVRTKAAELTSPRREVVPGVPGAFVIRDALAPCEVQPAPAPDLDRASLAVQSRTRGACLPARWRGWRPSCSASTASARQIRCRRYTLPPSRRRGRTHTRARALWVG